MTDRENCPMRHENGNCLPCGGFCLAVNDEICEALHNAFQNGRNTVMSEIAQFFAKKNWYRRERNENA